MPIIGYNFIFKLKLFSIKFVDEYKASKVISIFIISFKKCIITGGNEVYKGMIFQNYLI